MLLHWKEKENTTISTPGVNPTTLYCTLKGLKLGNLARSFKSFLVGFKLGQVLDPANRLNFIRFTSFGAPCSVFNNSVEYNFNFLGLNTGFWSKSSV